MRREPDNQDVIDDSGSYDVRELRGRRIDPELVDLIARSVERLQPKVRYDRGSVAIVWLTIAMSIVAAISGWTLLTIINLREDMAVMKCQLSPECRKPLMRGGSE